MKAFLLAAGIGSRLFPITEVTPKCMVDIGGRPLLDLWLDALADAGVDEVLVNVHHLPDVVCAHLAARSGPPQIIIRLEPELLGSAGTLLSNRTWVGDDDMFLAFNADNLTDFDPRALISAHRDRDDIATIAVVRSANPSAGGVVELDDTLRVVSFVEKPASPTSDLINAGMYAFDPEVFDEIEGLPPLDIGHDLLPRLVGRMHAVFVGGYFRDIGTIDVYERAQEEWAARTHT
jgi:mannose-1-phosphate guanylyltransferase